MLKTFSRARTGRGGGVPRGSAIVLALGLCLVGAASAAAPPIDAAELADLIRPANETLEDRLETTRALIDEYRLDLARPELDALLRENPASPAVHRLYARYHLSAGYRMRDAYAPASLQAAAALLAKSVELAPDDAAGYVLQGFTFRQMGRPADARAALGKAEDIGTDDPWLDLNWGWLLLQEERHEQAAKRFRNVLSNRSADLGQRTEARYGLVSYFFATDRLEDADRIHRDIIASNPDSALLHANYANFLLCARDDHAGAILHAKQAREREDSVWARLTLGGALYRKWSVQVAEADLEQAYTTYGQAYGVVGPQPAMALHGACNGYAFVDDVLRVMQATGKGERMAPMVAVLMAAEAEAPVEFVPGIFALTVEGTGRDDGSVFLNSHADYRDQRNLTVRLTPAAAEAFRRTHGSEADVLLKGRAIEVRGYARRVKIGFRQNGLPTGKYYYQTHVVVEEPEQISFAPR